MAFRCPFEVGVAGERVLGFGDTNRKMATFCLELVDLLTDPGIGSNAGRAVQAGGYGFDFIPEGGFIRVEETEVVCAGVDDIENRSGQTLGTFATLRPVGTGDDPGTQ